MVSFTVKVVEFFYCVGNFVSGVAAMVISGAKKQVNYMTAHTSLKFDLQT